MLYTSNAKKLLIAPLDWGLGHTTRCIPIIQYLIQKNCQIWIAGNDVQISLLRREFPSLQFLHLDGYNIRYSKNPSGFAWNIFLQLPQLLKSISREKKWLKKKMAEFDFDIVISDNRYGLTHGESHNILITHQLNIISGLSTFTDRLIRYFNFRFIKKFDTCWAPDMFAYPESLAGKLSHPVTIPSNVVFIGPLSRFKREIKQPSTPDLLVIISGPEPQRSIFEEKVFGELKNFHGTAVVVRGLPTATSSGPEKFNQRINLYNHLPAAELNQLIIHAKLVLCRSGYSSVMDLVALNKKAILVPTPGQTEQEYLAKHLAAAGMFYVVEQHNFRLDRDIEKAIGPGEVFSPGNFRIFEKKIDELLSESSPGLNKTLKTVGN